MRMISDAWAIIGLHCQQKESRPRVKKSIKCLDVFFSVTTLWTYLHFLNTCNRYLPRSAPETWQLCLLILHYNPCIIKKVSHVYILWYNGEYSVSKGTKQAGLSFPFLSQHPFYSLSLLLWNRQKSTAILSSPFSCSWQKQEHVTSLCFLILL